MGMASFATCPNGDWRMALVPHRLAQKTLTCPKLVPAKGRLMSDLIAGYARPMDDATSRRRARAGLRAGAERAGARSHFRAMGIDPDRLDGPIVGIASTWTATMPCNLNHRRLAQRAAAAVEAAGGVPLTFNTIAVSDNQSQA